MNKKLFLGATAITAVAVAGVVYYRHEALKQLDQWLHPRVQDPDTEELLINGQPHRVPKGTYDEILKSLDESAMGTSGRDLHARYPNRFDEQGRLTRKYVAAQGDESASHEQVD